MAAVSASQILRLAPNARADLVNAIVDNWSDAEAAGLVKPIRIRQFFSRLLVETGGLRAIEESLTYSSVFRIRQVWPSRFKTDASAAPFVRNPQALAIKVYGGRMGNAAAPSTDGWDYRGGGMLQTTGRAGYRAMGFEANPEALREPVTAFRTALREWAARGCNAMADRDDVEAICRAINGGTNGLAEQRTWLAKAAKIWTDDLLASLADVPRGTVLRKGSSGDYVGALQRALASAGFYAAQIDDSFGGKTETAVINFQRARKLTPIDGVAGPKTLAALL